MTGASRGIGRRIALRLARDGARVALAARSAEGLAATHDEIVASGGDALVVPTDIREPQQVARLVERAEEKLGPVDVVVANSGIPGPTSSLWELDPGAWEETFRVNVSGTFLLCRAALPAMLGRGRGSIVVIGSATGKRPLTGRTPYAASKTALIGLVRTLAAETGPRGVRVNLVSPGPIDGERVREVMAHRAAAQGVSVERVRDELLTGSPLGRFTPPEDVAETVAFLAGDSARSITGEDVNVSSGLVMY